MKVQHIKTTHFNYHLPHNKIAQKPLLERDKSKLLVFKNDKIKDDYYYNISNNLPEESILIFNDTKVIEARIKFEKSSGSIIEIFCLEPISSYADITSAMSTKEKVIWKCLIGGAKQWKESYLQKEIKNNYDSITLYAKKILQEKDYYLIEFSWSNKDLCFSEILHLAGQIPLPPYMKREATSEDAIRYQTIYAKHNGSVAAPTAGLHFTKNIYEKLEQKNIQSAYLTLHVGAGTFMPVKSETLEGHTMHSEFIDVAISTIEFLHKNIHKNIIPVGTTSLRTIESLYWLGVKVILNPNINIQDLEILQWDAYTISTKNISVKNSLEQLIQYLNRNNLNRIITKTQLLITEFYDLKIATAIITNFHQPQSTLLLLITAFVKEKWKDIYAHALENDYRFLSYGDGCLLWKSD